MADVVVIGAGLSGLTAAGQLQRLGYGVVVVDKSRGLGGRVATRRIGATVLDHGCRYLQPFADPALSPIPALLQAGMLQPWQPETFDLTEHGRLQPAPTGVFYTAPQGMSAVAKALSPGLTVYRQWSAVSLNPRADGWRIAGQPSGENSSTQLKTLEARAVVVAIPAPQAAALMDGAAQHNLHLRNLVQRLRSVEFEAVITAMAGYGLDRPHGLLSPTAPGGWMIDGERHSSLRWAALDSSKRTTPKEAVVVIHSSKGFAALNIDRSDLESVGQELLAIAAEHLAPWLANPVWMQNHRWRYGFVSRPLGAPVLSCSDLPTLVGCGDWCSGGNGEGAIASGYQAAVAVAKALG